MRKWIDLLEGEAMPVVVYHGTTRKAWETTDGNGVCYFVASRDDAATYASEAGETEHYEKHGGEEIDDPSIELIVVEFRMADLLAIPGAVFEPDWGWVEGISTDRNSWGKPEPTWEESLAAVGSFCISDFHSKELGRITPAFT